MISAGLKNIQLLVTCRIDATIYKTIQSLGKKSKGGSKKKKKRKKVSGNRHPIDFNVLTHTVNFGEHFLKLVLNCCVLCPKLLCASLN